MNPAKAAPPASLLARLRHSTAARDGLYVLFAQGLATAIALGVDVLLFRWLSPPERGTLTAALGLRNILLYVADMGLALTTVRVASAYVAQGQSAQADAVFRRALSTRIALAAIVIALAAALSPLLSAFPLAAPARHALIWASAAALFGMTATSWGVDVSRSTRRFGLYFAHQFIEAALKAAAVVCVLVLFTGRLNSEVVLWAMAIAATVAGLASITLQRQPLLKRQPLDPSTRAALHTEISSFGRYAGAIALLQTVSAFVEVFLIQWQRGSTDTAVFEGARRLASVLPLLAGAIATVLLPRAAALESADACKAYVKKAFPVTLALAVVSAGALAAAASFIIPILWGDRYAQSIPALRWLCLAYGISIVLDPLMLVLFPLKRLGLLLTLNALSLALSIGLGIFLIPRLGPLGAAWSVLCVKVTTAIVFSAALALALKKTPPMTNDQ
ncbi:MAG TPA: oligosaccharide flippase family protein [Planctomycetota bacterium]|jgi:O-antigen/teichoic acid export membrane protein